MVIKKKMTNIKDIEKIINKGGSVTEEAKNNTRKEVKFTLRVPQEIIKRLDERRNSKIGNISRHQLILEILSKNLK